MKTIQINTTASVYEDVSELSKDDQELFKAALKARENAYAPYSKFNVGAAILLSNGKIVTGNNQENACYPSGLCAERTAIYYAGAQYPNEIVLKIAVVAGLKNKINAKPVPPCGACRQALLEYEVKQEKDIEVYFSGTVGEVVKFNTVANLLPFIFSKSSLKMPQE